MCRISVLFSSFLLLLSPLQAIAGTNDRLALVGEVAYSELMKFDYDRDGRINDVQFWVSFDIKPAVGKEGEPGYRPETGNILRYMKDVELGGPVKEYNQFNMLPDTPLGKAVPVSNIAISGDSVTFTMKGVHFTVKVKGSETTQDSIMVNDGIKEYPVPIFDGKLRILTAEEQ